MKDKEIPKIDFLPKKLEADIPENKKIMNLDQLEEIKGRRSCQLRNELKFDLVDENLTINREHEEVCEKTEYNDDNIGTAQWYKEKYTGFPEYYYEIFEAYSHGNLDQYRRNFEKELKKKVKKDLKKEGKSVKKTNLKKELGNYVVEFK